MKIRIAFILFAFTSGVFASSHTLLNDEQNTIDVFEKMSPFVVYVHNFQQVRDFFYQTHEVRAGTGSGILWDDKGHILTNYHVIRGAKKVAVTLKKGETREALIVGIAPRKDIALLKLKSTNGLPNANHHPQIKLADSSHLLVGQKTIAIGNPFGLDRTLTTGIISALGREVPGVAGNRIHDMIQTDASINPGNSGGPLLNSQGELIGMNTSIFSRSGASAGIGFAVPANTIKRIVNQLIRTGRVVQPGIGVSRLTDSIAARLGVKGVIVAEVMPDTPAAIAGMIGTTRDRRGHIHFGDIIIAVDGIAVNNYEDLATYLDKKKIGDRIELTFKRDDNVKQVQLTLIDIGD